MSSRAQRNKLAKEFAFYFAEKGYIPTLPEVLQDSNRPQKIKGRLLNKIFTNYDRLVQVVENDYSELLNGTKNTKVPESDPLAKLRASTTEK